jgi:hypothetical protein
MARRVGAEVTIRVESRPEHASTGNGPESPDGTDPTEVVLVRGPCIPHPEDTVLSPYQALRQFDLAPEAMLALARVLWPDLIVYRDYVYFADSFSLARFEQGQTWEVTKRFGMRSLAGFLNHRHVSDMLRGIAALRPESLDAVAWMVSNCWAARFREAFPDREFTFDLGNNFWVMEGPAPVIRDDGSVDLGPDGAGGADSTDIALVRGPATPHPDDTVLSPYQALRQFDVPPEAILAFARNVWPDLTVYRDYVYFADSFSLDAFARAETFEVTKRFGMRSLAGALNHRHVGDTLRWVTELRPDSFHAVAWIVSNCWAARFREAFPDREFTFDLGDNFWVMEGPAPVIREDGSVDLTGRGT